MRSLPDRSINCLITEPPDPPSTLALGKPIAWAEFWDEAKRISKPPMVHALFAQPFAPDLPYSNRKALKYEVVWEAIAPGFWRKSTYNRIPHDLPKLSNWKPAQKPLDLTKWIISTYSKPGDLVLDPFLGSGTTAIACQELGRHFIGGDSNPEYVAIARERLAQSAPQLDLCLTS